MGALQELRQALELRYPDAMPLGRGLASSVATGLKRLDGLLPAGGLARGRVTLWRPGGGATAVLRAACEAAVQRGERSAWVDAGGMQTADFWRGGPLLVRPGAPPPSVCVAAQNHNGAGPALAVRGAPPPDVCAPAQNHDGAGPASAREALVCAEELLRSGGFALVVLSGVGREAGREAVRLSRAARAGGSALVLMATDAAVAHLRVVSRTPPAGYRWRCNAFGEAIEVEAVEIEVEATSLGWSGRTKFELPVRQHRLRLSPEPRLVDRRGALPAARWRRVSRTGEVAR